MFLRENLDEGFNFFFFVEWNFTMRVIVGSLMMEILYSW